ncbi:polysaccharide biosynthesis/export family protein [Hymenobacter negativus]|uniref:Polysaccharide biosynthesis/export family protein n=1 Tax=Hymenobacter negativus TaxID=2795026 RepID=A0ABS0QBI3_9BACT|nr:MULTISPECIES: polysaccharide biosynthesis/export family protein [Bacteria]MBH8559980.1 polysaccharide biosynthesis/export family protein [Hymenobacter negativus]MBH8570598.1 polysaccharide biosynthesis/export family protein [Hymenobacter negativus]MBR7210336.1 polysaccharide biosynthesis/export family protein [Microvirga sp. STS02]
MPTFPFRRLKPLWLLALPALLLFSSCVSTHYYNQRTMFRLTDSQGRQLDTTKLRKAVNRTARNYLIQPNDFLEVRVNTNKGERILDPNGELQFGQPSGALPSRSAGAATSPSTSGNARTVVGQRPVGQTAGSATAGSEFLVQADGTVVLPLVNRVKVSGLSLLQADSLLQVRYNEYYKESFVTTRVTNNRVFILGAPGGQVITLANDNMNLIEVLALAGGLDGGTSNGGSNNQGFYRYGGKASNIRIIRGDLKNPRIQQVDLTTLDGMRRANLQMEPNDIIYVEPVHRPVLETLTDAAPIISFASLVLTTTLVIISVIK